MERFLISLALPVVVTVVGVMLLDWRTTFEPKIVLALFCAALVVAGFYAVYNKWLLIGLGLSAIIFDMFAHRSLGVCAILLVGAFFVGQLARFLDQRRHSSRSPNP